MAMKSDKELFDILVDKIHEILDGTVYEVGWWDGDLENESISDTELERIRDFKFKITVEREER